MTPQELKNSILQLAIQGKLVEQRPEEGTAAELYKQIQAEKQVLVKAGKIKKEKPLPKITEDEIPFDIPESWMWVRLNSLISLLSGSDLTPDKYNDQAVGIPYITGASNIENNKLIINRWTEYPNNIAHSGDLLLTCKGTVGKTTVLSEAKVHIARQLMAITPVIINISFLQFFISSQVDNLKSKAKSMIPGIERDNVLKLPFPLPPLAEQERIVAKIEELLPLIDRYEQAWSRLEDFNKRFPGDMQKSILQMAIQGKLVEQRPEEGTGEELYQQIQAEKQVLIKAGKIKKEKPLPEITEDEIPFEIPESWKWVRIGKIVNGLFAGGDKPSDFSEKADDVRRIPVIANGITNDGILGYTATPTAKANTITVAGRGTIGFSLFREYAYCPVVRVIVIEQNSNVYPQYLQRVLQALPEKSLGTSIPQLTVPMLYPKLIPLPPLAEQKRIVAKLEELLPLCERLM